MNIRHEMSSDWAEIAQLLRDAFTGDYEAELVERPGSMGRSCRNPNGSRSAHAVDFIIDMASRACQVASAGRRPLVVKWPSRLILALMALKRSGLSAPALRDFDSLDGGSDPRKGTVHKRQQALEAAGVRFIDADDHDGSSG